MRGEREHDAKRRAQAVRPRAMGEDRSRVARGGACAARDERPQAALAGRTGPRNPTFSASLRETLELAKTLDVVDADLVGLYECSELSGFGELRRDQSP